MPPYFPADQLLSRSTNCQRQLIRLFPPRWPQNFGRESIGPQALVVRLTHFSYSCMATMPPVVVWPDQPNTLISMFNIRLPAPVPMVLSRCRVTPDMVTLQSVWPVSAI